MIFHQGAHGLVFGPDTSDVVSVGVFAHSMILVRPVEVIYQRRDTPFWTRTDKKSRRHPSTWGQSHGMRTMSICN